MLCFKVFCSYDECVQKNVNMHKKKIIRWKLKALPTENLIIQLLMIFKILMSNLKNAFDYDFMLHIIQVFALLFH